MDNRGKENGIGINNKLKLKDLYQLAVLNDKNAIQNLLKMFHPYLFKNSFHEGKFDSDCYQELCIKLIDCIKKFQDPSEEIILKSFLYLSKNRKILKRGNLAYLAIYLGYLI